MSDYLHGAYGQIQAVGTRAADTSRGAIVYIGTAPVNQVEGGAANVNKPIVVNNMAQARKLLGYSDDWASYTLCEAMKVHLEQKGVGPIVCINVLDPTKHKQQEKVTQQLAPANGRIVITLAENIIQDSLEIKTTAEDAETKEKGTDYTLSYNADRQQLVIQEAKSGALGTEALNVSWELVDPEKVTEKDVIGSTDGHGLNTGIFAVKSVYSVTGYVPAYMAAPGWSSIPEVHTAMVQNSAKINKHWDAYIFADLPITDKDSAVNLDTVAIWKISNGYTHENETVYFPLATGTDGATYHISVLAAANFQALLLAQDGIPYKTASNTECPIIQNLYMGEENVGRVYDDEIINEYLNKNGIASAAFVGGRWVIWGAHSANYNQDDANQINVAETNRMMLHYISNDFQIRRARNVDKPTTSNDLATIVSEEQTRLDALVKIGALTYGKAYVNASADAKSDIMMGDFSFTFDVTTTPLAKSMTAIVNWTEDGFVTYFAASDNAA